MRHHGFTLLEVVVASVLMQVVILAVMGTLTKAAQLRTEAESLERAIGVAESLLDSLLVVDSLVDGAVIRGSQRAEWSRSGSQLSVTVRSVHDHAVTLSGWVGDR